VLLNAYSALKGKARDYLIDVFNAADLNSNNFIDFNEFTILFKFLEPDR